jgi:hypothetical protein
MPSTLEQRQPREGRTGVIQASEHEGSEVPEYDETGLRELIDQAHEQVRTDQTRIVRLVDSRMPDSSGLDRQKVAAIFSGRGFADRIQNAKDAIGALAKQTQEKIAALISSGSENRTEPQPVENELAPGSHTDEAPPAMTLDKYVAQRQRTGLGTIQDAARLAQLRLKGVKDAERVLGFVHYLEEKAVGHEHRTLWVKDSEKEKERAAYQKKGYSAYSYAEDRKRDGKVQLSIGRDIPFRFDMRNVRKAAELTRSGSDPVELFERLRSLGYKVYEPDLSLYSAGVKKLLDDPNVMPLLKKLQSVEGRISLPKTQFLFDGSSEANKLLELAELDAKQNILNETALKNLSTISEIVGHPIQSQSMETWLGIADDPGLMALLSLARDRGSAFSQNNETYLLRNLEILKNAGIVGDIAALAEEGFDPAGLLLDQLGSYEMRPSVSEIASVVQELRANPDLKKLVLEVASEMGIQPTTNPNDFEKFRICFSRPNEALDLLRVAKAHGVLKQGTLSEDAVEQIFKNQSVVEIVARPDFSDFLSSLERAGYKPTADDLFPWAGSRSQLLDVYQNKDFIATMAVEKNIEVAKYLDLFGSTSWGYHTAAFEDLARIPDVLQLLKTMEQKFGYHYDITDISNTQDMMLALRDGETMKRLFQPETVRLFDALKETGYKFRGERVFSLIELSSDQNFVRQLSDPEIVQFIKDTAHNPTPAVIMALAGLSPSLRPTVRTLALEFGYVPMIDLSGHLYDTAKFLELSGNRKILETARALRNLNTPLHPIHDYEKLEVLAKKNLIEVFAQCRGFPEIQNLILKNADLITSTSKEKLSVYFSEILKNSESKPIRDQKMLRGELMGFLLREHEYATLTEIGNSEAGRSKETERIIEKLKQFVEGHEVSGKGQTIATLLAMREHREGEGFSELLGRIEKSLDAYEELLERYAPHAIPKGLRASIGMEYEITQSTAQGYAESNSGDYLKADMTDISRFANVGRGKDAVFEIATKPTDNPHLMLLEMQLLQDLEFIDLNFRRPGYERGSRGYHMTIGGEYGINVSPNSNFLQNMLIVSGWGGINAGKEVNRLSKGKNENIRQRATYDTQAVFENTRPAVEFRSLSLDTWEPFERAVETSYYGAIAIQAFEKHIANVDTQGIVDLKADNPEQLHQLLQQKGLLKEATDDVKTRHIIFEWVKLQQGVFADLADHNQNFLQNELHGYEDERGDWIDPQEFGGGTNRDRFMRAVGSEKALAAYVEWTHIEPNALFKEATPELVNRCTAIANLFIKSSRRSGGDVINATSSLDTTKVGRTIEVGDPQAKYRSFFDVNGKIREGYYYVQGGSERMLLHKAQMRLLEFNQSMQRIIS